METDVAIVGKGDPPPWPGLKVSEHVTDGTRWAILEGGMQSGRGSVAIAVPLREGGHVFVEISYRSFEAVAAAFRGARERWDSQ